MAEPTTPAARRRARRTGAPVVLGVVPGALRPRRDLLRSTALQAVFLAALTVPAGRSAAQTPAPTALPSGGQVIAGQAKITTATGPGTAAMTVKQATAYGAYDWKSFDIGKSASVTYQVPTSQSVSVNRVVSPTSPSIIAGKLTSNGVVVVQNQSGVVFTQGAEVNVNTLIASAPGISDANARAGRLIFDQPARPGAKVENRGTITVVQTGLAALVAPQVANSGVIRAQMGRVVLAGAEAHTVDLYGDGLLSIDVTKQVTQVAAGPDGKTATALVTNSGTVLADGGTILLTASAVDGLVQTLVTSGGTVRANTAGTTPGRVAVTAKGGNIAVTGTIAAAGTAAGSKGGQVEINAPSRSVTLKSGAKVDVSGKSGGGTAAIGTTLARAIGGPATKAPTAHDVVIESGARVAADATLNGSGGNVTVLSQGGTTRHAGKLSARGGPQGGNGGFVETSGDTLALGGRIDVSAPAGTSGSILLDPIDLVISNTATTGGGNAPVTKSDSITTKAGAGTTNLKSSDILALSGNITIEALGTLTINAAVDTSATAAIGDVTFKSGSHLVVNAPVTIAGTKTLALTSGGSIALGATLTAGAIDLTAAAGGVAQSAGSLVASALLSSGGINGSLSLTKATNKLGAIGNLTVTGGDLLIANSTALDIAGAVTLDAGKTASFAAPGFTASTGSIATGTFELAPLAGTMSLGAATATELVLTPAALSKITADTLRLGSAAAGGVTATSIALNDTLDTSAAATTRLVAGTGGVTLTKGALTAATLDITTAGSGVTDAGGSLIAATLQSTGGIVGEMALATTGHAISTLGTLAVTGGGLSLLNVVDLNVAGTVQLASDSALFSTTASAKSIEVTGSIALTTSGKGLTLVAANPGGGVTLAGTVDTTVGGALVLGAGSLGITQSGGAVTTGFLASTGAAGTVALSQAGNAISAIGDFAVSGGNFQLNTGAAVAVIGTLSAENVAITSSAASASAIALSGAVSATKGSIDLSAGAGGILQTAGSLTAPALVSTGGAAGTVNLGSADNAFDTVGAFKVSGGTLLLASKTALDVTGTLAVDPGQTLTLLPATLKISTGALSATGGTVEIAPIDGATMSLGKAAAAELAITPAELGKISSATLRLGGSSANATVADSLVVRDAFDATLAATATLRLDAGANGITIDSAAVLKANTLDLNAAGNGINGVAGASVSATRLQSTSGITGDAALANSVHSIGTLGDVTVQGTLALATSLALDIAGKVATKGASIDSAAADAKAIAVTGQLGGDAGTTITLKASHAAGGIALSGTADATSLGTLDLAAGTGGIVQSAGTAVAGTLLGSTTGNLTLAGAANQFGAVGKTTVAGDVSLSSASATTVAGPVTATNVAITSSAADAKALDVTGSIKATGTAALSTQDGAGGIAISGTLDAAVIDLSAGTGGIAQSGGALAAATLRSSGGSGGTVALTAPGNAVTGLGAFSIGNAGDFALATGTTLKVNGPVSSAAGNITLTTTAAGTLDIAGDVTSSKATIALRATHPAGGIALGAKVDTQSGTIDLVAGSGGVGQTAGVLNALRLVSSAGITGTVKLGATGNTLLGIGDLAVSSGDFSLVNSGPLSVAGTLAVTAGNVLLDVTDPSSTGLAVPGAISATNVTLVGRDAAGAIAIPGAVTAAGTLDLSVTGAGGVTASGTVTAGTLLSSLGVAGSVALTGQSNTLGTVGAIAAKAGDITLVTKAGTGATLAGTLAVDAGRSVSLAVDALTITTGAITAPSGTVEIRAATTGLSLGATNPGDLALLQADLGKITTDTLRLASDKGAVTLRADFDTKAVAPNRLRVSGATGVVLSAGTLSATTVELAAAAGGITQTTGVISATSLTTGAGTVAGSITLDNAANSIAAAGPLKATGTIALTSGTSLAVADTISAAEISLTGGAAGTALTLAPGGTLALTAPGTIAIATSNATGTTTLAGTVDAKSGGTLLLSGAGAVSQTGGQITAGTIATTGTIGSADLGQAANSVAALGAAAASGDLTLATSQPLTAASAVSAANITLRSAAASPGAITVSSASFATAAGGTMALAATDTKGGIALSGTLSTGATGTIDLAAGSTGVAQSAGSLTTGTLRSTGGIGGPVSLSQANAIAALGPLAASGGLTLVSSQSLGIGASVAAGAGTTLSLAAPGMSFSGAGALSAVGGTVELGPTTGTATIGLGTAGGDFALGSLANVTASVVRIGQAASAGNANKAASIALADAVTPNATTLELISSGAITQAKGGLAVPILSATAASLALGQSGNSIGALGPITVTGDLALANDGVLAVTGTLSAANITLRSAAASVTALDISGTLATTAGGTITLTASNPNGGIALSGKLDATATGTIDLSSGSAGITQSAGALTAAVLRSTGGTTGNATLDQPGNAIASLGNFTVTGGTLTLRDSLALDITGTVAADAITLRSAGATLSLAASGSLSSAGSTLLAATDGAGGIAIAGTVNAATLDLSAGTAGIDQTGGTVSAATLLSSGGSTGAVSIAQPGNAIATLAAFSAPTSSLTVAGATPITVTGPVAANLVTLRSNAASAKAIDVTGSITATGGGTISLAATDAAGGIALSGTLSAPATGAIDLSAGSAGITQTAGSLAAATLRSTSGVSGDVTLTQSANKIANLGSFTVTGGDFSLTNSIALTIPGTVSAGSIAIDGNATGTAILLTGDLAAPGGQVALTATNASGGLSLAGAITANTVEFTAGSGGIAQPAGSIAAATLRTTVTGGSAVLDRSTNSIATLGASTVTGGTLVVADSIPLAITGAIKADNISIAGTAGGTAITVSDSLTATAGGTIALSATSPTGALDLGGPIDATSTGVLDLASGGSTTQSAGAITAGTLQSTGKVGGDLILSRATNAIGGIGALAVSGTAGIVSSIPLTMTGPLSAATLSVTGTAAGTAIALTGSASATGTMTLAATHPAGGIALSGTASAGLLDLSSGTGGITQTAGSLSTATLRSIGGTAGPTTLDQAGNAIATLGNFTVSGGAFTLRSGIALDIAGKVSADAVTLRSSAAAATALSVSGSLTTAGTALLATTDASGGLVLSGQVQAATLDLSAGTAGIAQPAGAIKAGTLTSSSGSAGNVDLGQAANSIAAIADFAVAGAPFNLADAASLSVTGTLKASGVSLASTAAGTAISVPGTIAAATITLAAQNAAGGIALSGELDATATGTVDLSAGTGGVTQSAGRITAGLLRSTGGSSGDIVLGQAANAIGILGSFAVSGGSFSLADSAALTVSGPVSATGITIESTAAGFAIATTGDLSAPGGSIGLTASGATGGISLGSTITGNQLILSAGSFGVVQSGGSISTSILRASVSGGDASLERSGNAIAELGTTTITGGALKITDSTALAVTGAITADSIAITGSAAGTAISVTGDLTTSAGGTIALAAPDATGAITLAGTVNATATGSLDLSSGADVTQSAGTLTAGTLRSATGIGGSLSLPQATNAIGRVASLTVAGDVVLANNISMDIAGALAASNVAIKTSAVGTQALAISGSASATAAMTLASAGGIELSGTVKATTLDLVAGKEGVSQTSGSLTAGTLTITTSGGGGATLGQGGNAIATLGDVAMLDGNLSLLVASPLTVAGTVAGNVTVIQSNAAGANALSVTGAINSSSFVALSAGNPSGGVALSGTVVATDSVSIDAGSAGVLQSGGSVSGKQLSGRVTGGTMSLTSPGNTISTIGAVAISGGGFALVNSTGLVTNQLTADTIAITALAGTISANFLGIATAPGGSITLAATAPDGGIALNALSGGSALNASGSGIIDLTAGTGGVVQSATGVIIAGTLRSTGGIGGAVQLDKASNVLGSIADLAATGSFSLTNTIATTVAGTLSAATIGITDSAGAAKAIDITGTVRSAAGGSIALVASTGGIALSGTVDASPTGVVDLNAAAAGVAQTAGTVTTALLRSSNGLGGNTALDQAGNAIGNLGPMDLAAGNLSVVSGIPLTVSGPVSITVGNLALSGSAPGAALVLASPVTVSGTAKLAATGATGGITLASTLKAAALDLAAGTGGVTQTAGSLTLGTLQASGLNGSVSLAQPGNTIAMVGAFVLDSGDVALTSGAPLTVIGPVKATQGNITITGFDAGLAAISIPGTIASGTGKTTTLATPSGGIVVDGKLSAPGGLLVMPTATGIAAKGTLAADKVAVSSTATGSKTGNIALSGANSIGTLVGAVINNGTLLLNNAAPLTISGPLTARILGITAAGSLKLSDGVTITTDGKTRTEQGVSNTLTDAQIAALTTSQLGSYLAVTSVGGAAGKIEVGKVAAGPFSAATATVDFVLPQPGAGTISLGQFVGKTTDLILIPRAGGITTGTVDVAGLLVLGTGGKADLFGQIGGVDGQAAANRANISPQPNSNYRFNACPITSVNCVLIPIQTVPPISPLRDVPIIRDRPTQDDTDVQLPNVSDEDY